MMHLTHTARCSHTHTHISGRNESSVLRYTLFGCRTYSVERPRSIFASHLPHTHIPPLSLTHTQSVSRFLSVSPLVLSFACDSPHTTQLATHMLLRMANVGLTISSSVADKLRHISDSRSCAKTNGNMSGSPWRTRTLSGVLQRDVRGGVHM